ncbi:MAG: hypothetical protein ACR2OF_04495, partial [Hyphomicrobium sp.]
MSLPQPPKPTKRKTLTPYVAVWVVLGGFALAYLTLLGLRPDALAGLKPAAGTADQEVVALQRDVTRALADLDPLRNTLGKMNLDVTNLKTGMQAAADRDAQIAKRLNVLEGTSNSKTPNAALPDPVRQKGADAGGGVQMLNGSQAQTDPIDTASLSRPAIALAATQPSTIAPAAVKPQPVKKKVPVKAPATVPVKTPVKTAAVKKAPAKEPPKVVGVQLATGPSVASLQLNWSVLADRNKDALGHLQPRYTTRGRPSKRTYDLVAGPLGSAQQA